MTRTAVVTGAHQGVGLEISRRLISLDWHVVGLARSEDKLTIAARDLGSKFSYFATDVRDALQVERTFAALGKIAGAIELLVNNASVFQTKPFAEFQSSEIEKILDTNLKGTIYCTLEALKLMAEGARIVNIASVAATHGVKNQAVYCASKFGVDGFAEALNQETIARGISITTICPGGIDTPLWNAANPYPGDRSRLLTAADIADAVAYVTKLPKRVVLKKMTLFPDNEWH